MKEKAVKDKLNGIVYEVRLGEDLWDKEKESLLFLEKLK